MTASLEDLITLYARDLMDAHGLEDWSIHWGDNDRWAGMTYRDSKVICFNRHHLLDTAAHNIRETILHEIAHALTPGHDHDRAWWEMLIDIGGTGWWGFNDGRVGFSEPEEGLQSEGSV